MINNLTVKRYELKYYINRVDYENTRLILKKLMKRDSFQMNEKGYLVRSLYFDDIYDSAVEEKLAGVERRNKYRLRIYDFEQNWVKLERKRKLNDYIQKSTSIISRREALSVVNGQYDDLLHYENQELNSIYFDLKKKFMKPVVILDYIRDAFLLDYNSIRITFDKNLRYTESDLSLFNSHTFTKPIQSKEVIIMEVKFNNFLPSWFSKILKIESLTKSAVSKYCQARVGMGDYSTYF